MLAGFHTIANRKAILRITAFATDEKAPGRALPSLNGLLTMIDIREIENRHSPIRIYNVIRSS